MTSADYFLFRPVDKADQPAPHQLRPRVAFDFGVSPGPGVQAMRYECKDRGVCCLHFSAALYPKGTWILNVTPDGRVYPLRFRELEWEEATRRVLVHATNENGARRTIVYNGHNLQRMGPDLSAVQWGSAWSNDDIVRVQLLSGETYILALATKESHFKRPEEGASFDGYILTSSENGETKRTPSRLMLRDIAAVDVVYRDPSSWAPDDKTFEELAAFMKALPALTHRFNERAKTWIQLAGRALKYPPAPVALNPIPKLSEVFFDNAYNLGHKLAALGRSVGSDLRLTVKSATKSAAAFFKRSSPSAAIPAAKPSLQH